MTKIHNTLIYLLRFLQRLTPTANTCTLLTGNNQEFESDLIRKGEDPTRRSVADIDAGGIPLKDSIPPGCQGSGLISVKSINL